MLDMFILFNNIAINLHNYHCSRARIFNVENINAERNSHRKKSLNNTQLEKSKL